MTRHDLPLIADYHHGEEGPTTVKTILLDFDGVLHSYVSGWQGADVIPDPPVEHAINFLRALLFDADQRFEVCIYSSRSDQLGGIPAVREWFRAHGLKDDDVEKLWFPVKKPPAHLTIDDRAMRFTGTFPSLQEIADFQPWNKKLAKGVD